jgi:Ser/Thr protein kinase RdoA (MazF antagonist)
MSQETKMIPQILSFFDLGQPVKISPIKQGISNHNYFVETAEDVFVVKFLVGQTAVNIENDIAIQKQLASLNMATPSYLYSTSGNYVYKKQGLQAVISRKIEGIVPTKINLKLAFEFGQKLSLFHRAVTKLPHPNANSLMNPKVSGVPSVIFSHDLPRGIIHGDFHLGNALVSSAQNRVIAILDFEEAAENLFLVDLAVTIMAICTSTNDDVLDYGLMKETIRGYQSHRKLCKLEQGLLPEGINYAAKTWIKWFEDNNYVAYAQKHRVRLNSFVGL